MSHSWNGADFKKLAESTDRINQEYDEAFISVFMFEADTYYAEHNEYLDEVDVKDITASVLAYVESVQ